MRCNGHQLSEQGKCQVTMYSKYIPPQACECQVNKLDMQMLDKIMLNVTLNPEGRILLPGFCHHVAFPRGPLSVMDLPSTQNSATIHGNIFPPFFLTSPPPFFPKAVKIQQYHLLFLADSVSKCRYLWLY